MKILGLALSAIVLLSACGPSTVITKSWRDPGTTVTPGYFKKPLVAALMKDEASRRVVEDNLAKRIPGAIPSYSVFGATDSKLDEAAINAKMQSGGFDGAVVVRFLSMDKETSYVPGSGVYPSYYGGFGPYWRTSYNSFYSPGYYTEDKVYTVESNVYDLKQNKLIWSGVTSSTNPGKVDKTTNEIADVIAKKMREEGFLQ